MIFSAILKNNAIFQNFPEGGGYQDASRPPRISLASLALNRPGPPPFKNLRSALEIYCALKKKILILRVNCQNLTSGNCAS